MTIEEIKECLCQMEKYRREIEDKLGLIDARRIEADGALYELERQIDSIWAILGRKEGP